MCVCVCALCSKHQVFENATLASLLPTGGEGSGKESTPTMAAEGGVKIKHTILPRPKDSYQADLAESALPATAHWYVCMYVCMCVCMYMYVYVCMCVWWEGQKTQSLINLVP